MNPTLNEEQLFLTNEEKNILKVIRNKRVLLILSAYLGMSFALVEIWVRIFEKEPYWGLPELIHFRFLPAQFLIVLFAVLTFFFTNYYFKIVHPYVKDIRIGLKDIIIFTPERYKTPFFSDYYLKTPLKKRPLIKINQELYDAMAMNPTANIHLSPRAKYVFLVEIAGRKMKFNGSDALTDL